MIDFKINLQVYANDTIQVFKIHLSDTELSSKYKIQKLKLKRKKKRNYCWAILVFRIPLHCCCFCWLFISEMRFNMKEFVSIVILCVMNFMNWFFFLLLFSVNKMVYNTQSLHIESVRNRKKVNGAAFNWEFTLANLYK